MKQVIGVIILILLLTACHQTKETEADTEQIKQETEQQETNEPEQPEVEKQNKSQDSNDIYTHYDNATWSDNFNGLESRILKVVTTNDLGIAGQKHSMVGIKLQVENTTNEEFKYRPCYGTLVLSTGEQAEIADSCNPSEITGTIYEGVKITSNINFLVESNVDDIDWIKFIWHVGQTGDDNVYDIEEEYKVKLELKKTSQ